MSTAVAFGVLTYIPSTPSRKNKNATGLWLHGLARLKLRTALATFVICAITRAAWQIYSPINLKNEA